jgi:hypothetical protein
LFLFLVASSSSSSSSSSVSFVLSLFVMRWDEFTRSIPLERSDESIDRSIESAWRWRRGEQEESKEQRARARARAKSKSKSESKEQEQKKTRQAKSKSKEQKKKSVLDPPPTNPSRGRSTHLHHTCPVALESKGSNGIEWNRKDRMESNRIGSNRIGSNRIEYSSERASERVNECSNDVWMGRVKGHRIDRHVACLVGFTV